MKILEITFSQITIFRAQQDITYVKAARKGVGI